MKKNKGITLLELIIAMSLLTLIIFAGGGIYLSGWLMFRDAQFMMQAQRKAMIAMAHMVKNLKQAASECNVTDIDGDGDGDRIDYMQYAIPPTITSRYDFQSVNRRISYIPNISVPGTFQIIGTNIDNCNFVEHHSNTQGIVVDIIITATDNNQQNSYILNSSIEARYTGTPPVY